MFSIAGGAFSVLVYILFISSMADTMYGPAFIVLVFFNGAAWILLGAAIDDAVRKFSE